VPVAGAVTAIRANCLVTLSFVSSMRGTSFAAKYHARELASIRVSLSSPAGLPQSAFVNAVGAAGAGDAL
jgi:hypothetical protein